jgi:asparagine synthetase B (glutamine-hydrolysing)
MKNFLLSNKENIINLNHKIKFGNFFFHSNFKPILQKKNNKKIIFFGDLYGEIKNEKVTKISILKAIQKISISKNYYELIDTLDGRFIFFVEENNKITIHTDKFSRYDLFYSHVNKNYLIGNNFHIIYQLVEAPKINQLAISHMINVLGTKPAKKDTIFSQIKRLGVNESFLVKNKIDIVMKKFIAERTEEYKYEKIEEYYQIFENYLSNMPKGKKTIFMSSGYDSSFLASVSSKVFGKKNVSGVTLIQKFSKRSKIYNKFEVDRVKKIGKYLDIKINFGEINLDQNFHKYAETFSDISPKRMTPMTLAAIMHHELSKISNKKSSGDQLLSGEVSDGVHNFGFSQYANFFGHDSNGLREYVDKMMNYLYSPSFFKKLVNNNYKDDYVYKLLLKMKKINTNNFPRFKNLNDVKDSLLNSLFLTDKRFPLYENQSSILKENKVRNVNEYYKREYFDEINIKNKDELYSIYIHLYNSFHWQAGTVSTMYELPDHHNLKMNMPFWNPVLHSYLSKMPESWGRGLETRTLKYPLKENLSKKFDIMNVLNLGPHSYQYDVNRFSDPFLEILISKSAKKYITNLFKKYHPCSYLDSEYFKTNLVYKIVKDYEENKIDKSKTALIYRLFTLSKLLQDIKY